MKARSPEQVQRPHDRSATRRRYRYRQAVVGALAGCLLSGCGDLAGPMAELPPVDAAIEASMVTERKFDWPVTADGFQIAKPPRFAFIEQWAQSHREGLREKIDAAEQAPAEQAAAQQELDKALGWFSPEVKDLWRTPPAAVGGTWCFAMNEAGDRLVTVGDALRVWEVQTGRQASQTDLPLSDAQAVLYDVDERFVWVAGPQSVMRVDLQTGKAVRTVAELNGTIARWELLSQPAVVAGAYHSGQLFRFGTSDSRVHSYAPEFSSMHPVDSSADDQFLIGWTSDGAVVVEQEDGKAVGRHLHRETGLEDVVDAVCHDDTACWIAPDRFAYVSLKQLRSDPTTAPQQGYRASWSLHSAVPDRGTAWPGSLLISATRADLNRVDQQVLVQIQLSSGIASAAGVIDGPQPERICCDPTTAFVAMLQDGAVRVVRRPVWAHCSADFVGGRAVQLMTAGKLDQLDTLGQLIRSYGEPRMGFTPELLFQTLMTAIGERWMALETAGTDGDQLARLEGWRQQGGELALCASAYRHVHIGWRARGSGTSETVTNGGWRTLFDRLDVAKKDNDQVLQLSRPPAIALAQCIQLARSREKPMEEQEATIQRAIELYPADWLVHEQMSHWLLPRWAGMAGETAGYANAIADLIGGPEGDMIYVACAASIYDMFGGEYFYAQTQFDFDRMRRGALAYLELQPGDRTRIEKLWRMMLDHGDEDTTNAFRRYYHSRFVYHPR